MKSTFLKIAAAGAAVSVLGLSTIVFAQTQAAARSVLDLACLQNTVERRDMSIIAAFDGYHATLKSALEGRRDGLKSAFGIPERNRRQISVRNAWNTYKTTQRSAKTTLRDARNAAWKKFTADRKACGKGAEAEDKTPSGVDAEL